MKVIATAIKDVVIIEPQVFGDDRGYFFESYSQQQFDQAVRPVHFVQDNESKSRRGVLRGLHFQKGAAAQSKLVRVVQGTGSRRRRGYTARIAHVRHATSRRSCRPRITASCSSPRIRTRIRRIERRGRVPVQMRQLLRACEPKAAIAWDDPALGIDWQLPADESSSRRKTAARPR